MRTKIIESSLIILIVALFSGCANKKVFVHPEYSQQRFSYDKAICNNFAHGAYGNIPYQNIPSYNNQYKVSGYVNNTYYNGTITQQPTIQQNINGIAQGIANIAHQNRIEEAFDACMFQKGWRLENKKRKKIEYGPDGYNVLGYDKEGYNKKGINVYGKSRDGYNKYGYDKEGYDRDGYDVEGYDKNGEQKN